MAMAAGGDEHAENRGDPERMQVVRVREQRGEIRQPDELRALAERILQLERVPRRPATAGQKKNTSVIAICGATSA